MILIVVLVGGGMVVALYDHIDLADLAHSSSVVAAYLAELPSSHLEVFSGHSHPVVVVEAFFVHHRPFVVVFER